MVTRSLAYALAAALLAAGCTPDSTEQTDSAPPAADAPAPAAQTPAQTPAPASEPASPPDRIVAERGGFVPEGIEYDHASGRFLVGSIAEGTIYQLHEDGRITPFAQDPELTSTIGIRVDAPRDRLLAANSDAAVFQGAGSGQAKLAVFSLTTGERIAMVDLAAVANAGDDARFFANDVAVAEDGTAYVTDTFAHVIYAVDTDYQASVLHRFTPPEGGMGLNGIVVHPDGYLLVAEMTSGGLLKVPLNDPAQAMRVQLPEPVPGADGMVWQEPGRLAVVSNSASRVVALTSNDDWASAQVAGVANFTGQGTTAAVVNGDIYVVQPQFQGEEPPVVLRARFQ